MPRESPCRVLSGLKLSPVICQRKNALSRRSPRPSKKPASSSSLKMAEALVLGSQSAAGGLNRDGSRAELVQIAASAAKTLSTYESGFKRGPIVLTMSWAGTRPAEASRQVSVATRGLTELHQV
jgi:hypothetical protein